MQIKILEKEKEKLSFLVKEADLGIVNALRRVCIESVPVLAIDEVEFVKNDSALFDEMIAHRLGLVPLKTPSGMKMRSECTCKNKGCAKCKISLKLSVKGKEVLSGDLKSKGTESVYDMPIVRLLPEQELEFTADACLGVGKEHAKFIPGLIMHRNVAKISIGNCENAEEISRICPKKVFEVKGGKLEVVKGSECDLCNACVDKCEGITVEPKEDEFVFIIESWGQLSPQEILQKELGKQVAKI